MVGCPDDYGWKYGLGQNLKAIPARSASEVSSPCRIPWKDRGTREPAGRVEPLGSSASVHRPFQLVVFVHPSVRDQAEGHVHQR